ncbi:MAG: formate/nitrite transporter family protein [Chloroflexota bacterium]
MTSATTKSAPDVFEPIVEQGGDELERSLLDLVLSGLIAGLDIGFGPLAMGVAAGRLHSLLHLSVAQALFFGSFLYPLGFIFVIAGRSELYTENTLAPLAGILTGTGTLTKVARRWGVVLACNIAGTILFSLLVAHTSVVFSPYKAIYQTMGLDLTKQPFLQAVLAGVFGGWLVALLSWLLQSTEGSAAHFLITYVVTYLLVALTLYHCVIGSIEVLLAMFAGAPITWADWFLKFLAPAVVGNTIGAVVFVTGLKGFQARSA